MLTPDFLFVMGTSGKKTSLHFQKFQVTGLFLHRAVGSTNQTVPQGTAALPSPHIMASLPLPTLPPTCSLHPIPECKMWLLSNLPPKTTQQVRERVLQSVGPANRERQAGAVPKRAFREECLASGSVFWIFTSSRQGLEDPNSTCILQDSQTVVSFS